MLGGGAKHVGGCTNEVGGHLFFVFVVFHKVITLYSQLSKYERISGRQISNFLRYDLSSFLTKLV